MIVDGSVGLVQPIPARLNGREVVILELWPSAALVEHTFRLEGETRLAFHFEEERLELIARVLETQLQEKLSDREQRLVYHSRFEFQNDLAPLERAIRNYRMRFEQAMEANLSGEASRDELLDLAGRALRDRKLGFVSHVYRDGTWRRFETMSAEQPLYGFTVAAHESEEQVTLLRLAYEEADLEDRRLLRQFAAAALEPFAPPAEPSSEQ